MCDVHCSSCGAPEGTPCPHYPNGYEYAGVHPASDQALPSASSDATSAAQEALPDRSKCIRCAAPHHGNEQINGVCVRCLKFALVCGHYATGVHPPADGILDTHAPGPCPFHAERAATTAFVAVDPHHRERLPTCGECSHAHKRHLPIGACDVRGCGCLEYAAKKRKRKGKETPSDRPPIHAREVEAPGPDVGPGGQGAVSCWEGCAEGTAGSGAGGPSVAWTIGSAAEGGPASGGGSPAVGARGQLAVQPAGVGGGAEERVSQPAIYLGDDRTALACGHPVEVLTPIGGELYSCRLCTEKWQAEFEAVKAESAKPTELCKLCFAPYADDDPAAFHGLCPKCALKAWCEAEPTDLPVSGTMTFDELLADHDIPEPVRDNLRKYDLAERLSRLLHRHIVPSEGFERKGIGASLIYDVVVDPMRAYLILRGIIPALEDNDALKAGRYLEPAVRQWYADEKGVQIEGDGKLVVLHPTEDWMFCSPDGFVITDDGVEGYEGKNMNSWRGGELEDGLRSAPRYLMQCVWQAHICGFPRVRFAALIGGNQPKFDFTMEYVEYADMARELESIARHFWHEHVQKGIPPAVTGSESSAAFLRTYKLNPLEGYKPASADALAMADQYLGAAADLSTLEAIQKEAKHRLQAEIGEAPGLILDAETEWCCTWKPRKDGVRVFSLRSRAKK